VNVATPRRNTPVDYTRTCDMCARYIELNERINSIGPHEGGDGEIILGWYTPDGNWCNHLCDQCYLAGWLEGWA